MLDPNSVVPLYQQISDDIKRQIKSGEYEAGQILPSETKCCEKYQVSRVTIRNAIADLVDQGIVVKKHGKGTFVQKQKIPSNLFSFSGFTTTCRENHIKIRTHILCCRKQAASMTDIRNLNLKEGDLVVYLKRLRFADDYPVIIEHVYLPHRQYKFLLSMDLENRSLYETLAEKTGINPEEGCYTKITLEASSATLDEAQLLNLEVGKPLFILEETIISSTGEPIHWTKQIMAGNYFKFFLSNNQNRLSINLEQPD